MSTNRNKAPTEKKQDLSRTAGTDAEMRVCRVFKRCGGCQFQEPYAQQLKRKQEKAERMLSKFAPVRPIIAMDDPYFYRCKVQNIFGTDGKGCIISGIFQSTGQKITAVDACHLEDRRAAPVIQTLKKCMRDLKIPPYDLRTGQGILRHTLIRSSFTTGQMMLVLVTAGALLPAKKRLVQTLQKAHPELTTIVQNICPDGRPLTLGDRNIVLSGSGTIEDELCGCRFTVSPASFYQVNPKQTEKLYQCAAAYAGIKNGVRVLDAYCGTGTIGIICAMKGAAVTGVELNHSAVKDAVRNAKLNGLEQIRFYQGDAGKFMQQAAAEGERFDVLMMDPPRAGASMQFLKAAVSAKPKRIVYVSCKIETLERDLKQLVRSGYTVREIQPVDMFPHTTGIENVCLLERKEK